MAASPEDGEKKRVLVHLEGQYNQLLKKSTLSCSQEVLSAIHDLRTKLGTMNRSIQTHKALYDEWHEKKDEIFRGHDGGALQPEEEAQREAQWKEWLASFSPRFSAYLKAHVKVLESVQVPLRRMETIFDATNGLRTVDSAQPLISAVSESVQHLRSIAEQCKRIADNPDTSTRAVYSRTSSRDLVNDVFDGNNTVCCLSVDNKVHPDGIPLLDYMLDSGMHVLQLGEIKGSNRPKYCAWLWIGKHTKTGEVALVIDNVEGAPDFAASYRKEIRDVIVRRSKELATKAGIPKVVLGVLNNDIPMDGLEKVEGTYEKLGGFVHEEMIGGKKRPRGILHLEAHKRKVVAV
jgi:hypothetical protein